MNPRIACSRLLILSMLLLSIATIYRHCRIYHTLLIVIIVVVLKIEI
jgi:hypothetical protein